ncbi:MAG: GNAT family N-acetyltransferase [Desulfarculaceae bacterium]|nr:GNAT family N-acetyltransferase [Desulfarculaceae bacterium]MCF8072607.1 GNAT family N-acetyltransferase [Desulfarculaceae bacterium]MCF8103321.1 GNAT family N-acetyltransferase [Desulfarculaceae bacterium]MCF8117803.1 GNAT family N-acetyltransferase [Desulfarculaceae bacterium]
MNNSHYLIIDLAEEHLPGVLAICRQELGEDYHGEEDFRRCLSSERRFCQVALDERGQVRGFAVALALGPEPAHEFLKLPASPARDRLLTAEKIGILDAAAIAPEAQGGGLGRLLVRALYQKLLSRGAGVVCAMAWRTVDGHTNAAKLLEENGFVEELSIQGYWNRVVDSPEGHHCPVCPEPPCQCHGVLYLRHLEE